MIHDRTQNFTYARSLVIRRINTMDSPNEYVTGIVLSGSSVGGKIYQSWLLKQENVRIVIAHSIIATLRSRENWEAGEKWKLRGPSHTKREVDPHW